MDNEHTDIYINITAAAYMLLPLIMIAIIDK